MPNRYTTRQGKTKTLLSLVKARYAQERVNELRRFQSLKQQEIALRMKVAGQREMQELKKVKGKNSFRPYTSCLQKYQYLSAGI